MYSSSKRVLDILMLISQSESQEGYSSKEILDILSKSQKLNVSMKTVKNDLKKLKHYGFVIYEPMTRKNKLNKSLFLGVGKNV